MFARFTVLFHYRYKLDNGEMYSGVTKYVAYDVYLIFGASDILYWVRIGDEEGDEFTKIALVGKSRRNIENLVF